MIDYCCEECDYWEERIDIHIQNEIKEAKLSKIAKKQSFDTKVIIPTNIKATGGKDKTGGFGCDVNTVKEAGNSVSEDKGLVGPTSSQ